MMRVISRFAVSLIFLAAVTLWGQGQVATIGSGTSVNGSQEAAPINIYYRSIRTQTVYTAAELNDAGILGAGLITELGYYVTGSPNHPLPNFIIRMKHTSATNASEHDEGPFENVYQSPSYSPTVGNWDMLELDNVFVWNGIDNILVDTAFSLVPSYSSTGRQRIFSSANGMRYTRSDSSDQTNSITYSIRNEKPQIRFVFSDVFMLPENPFPANFALEVSISTGLSWNLDSYDNDIQVLFGTDNPPLTEIYNGQAINSLSYCQIGAPLQYNTTYYWQVNHINDSSITGPLWQFTTTPGVSDIVIGEVSTAYPKGRNPIDRSFAYSKFEMLYLSSEIGGSCAIEGIAIYKTSGLPQTTIENVDIYMKTSTATSLEFIWLNDFDISEYTHVYHGDIQNDFGEVGWAEVQLDEPYIYLETEGNLHILVVKNYQYHTTGYNIPNYKLNTAPGLCRGNSGSTIHSLQEKSERPTIKLDVSEFVLVENDLIFNATWHSHFLHYVSEDVTINPGVTLNILPGTRVYGKQNSRIVVNGNINALGNEEEPISFFGNKDHGWDGIFIQNTSVGQDSSRFVHCLFKHGRGRADDIDLHYYGGALLLENSDNVLISGSMFLDNSAQKGGAIYAISSSPKIVNSLFEDNSALVHGGAVAMAESPGFRINRTLFRNNTANQNGGALYIRDGLTASESIIANSLFDGNYAVNGGALALADNGEAYFAVVNNTIINNEASSTGGGLFFDSGTNYKIQNNILWNNNADVNGSQAAIQSNAAVDFLYSNIEDDLSGIYLTDGGVINSYDYCFQLDPLLSFSDTNPGWGYHLDPLSPCINAGDPNTEVSETGLYDINGNPRYNVTDIYSGNLQQVLNRIDVGAIEDQNDALILPDDTILEQDYVIHSNLYLYSERNLTISEGVTISFHPGVRAEIHGNLTAVGTADNRIKFTEAVPDSGWEGIFFFGESAVIPPYSLFEFCIIEKGIKHEPTVYGTAAGGNVAIYHYHQVDFRNSIIREGTSYYGGGVYFRHSAGSFVNCIVSHNDVSIRGGALYSNNSHLTIINSTIVHNTSPLHGALYFTNAAQQPEIKNSLFWHNGENPIHMVGDTLDNINYSNVEGGYANDIGTGNFSLNPLITYSPSSSVSDFELDPLSPCINAGDPNTNPDITGLSDVHGNPRVYSNTYYSGNLNQVLNRIDVGAIEDQLGELIIPSGTLLEQDYLLEGSLYLYEGRALTVQAGVTIAFAADTKAQIYGDLNAIGTHENMIVFTSSESDGFWEGFTFGDNSSNTDGSSHFEYCIIEKGVKPSQSWPNNSGGNIGVYRYSDLLVRNCIIREGIAATGGGLYLYDATANDATLNVVNTVFYNNHATDRGGAYYHNNAHVRLINCTIAGNTVNEATTNRSALYFRNVGVKIPLITNCIIWGNDGSSIFVDGSTLTNVTYSNIEGEYAGAGNIDVDPSFTHDSDHPYSLQNWSYCINAGNPDTNGFYLPDYDIIGNPRIYGHENSDFDRIDMGAYEVQSFLAPGNFSASTGSNDYPGYVQLYWDFNSGYNVPINGFRIMRNAHHLVTVDSQVFEYSDHTVIPGQFYTYQIVSYYGTENGYSEIKTGYVKPNGIISGNVKTVNNNPVMNVQISLSPSTGKSLQLSADLTSSIIITNPEANMNQNFTLELWVKTADSEVTLFSSDTHLLQIGSDNRVSYSDGLNILTQQDSTVVVNDNEWHHIAIVSDYTDDLVKMYLDGAIAAQADSFVFGNYAGGDFLIPTGFTGLVDDLRIWISARDSTEVFKGKNIVVPYNSPGLKGYWSMNEGMGDIIFDATVNAKNGVLYNCTWSSDEPGIALGALTDGWGDYVITEIPYGTATTFTVTPSKPGHTFVPQQRLVTLSPTTIAANNVDFTDNSQIPISGYVRFAGTQCPVVGAVIKLNGSPAVPPVITNSDGYYILEVEHGTECLISVDYKGHPFNREWNLGAVTYPRTNINFQNIFLTELYVEVVGGIDAYPIGEFDITIQSVDALYTRNVTNQNWVTGGVQVINLPPLNYNVTVNPAGNDPFDLVVCSQFQSMKTKNIDLRDATPEGEALSYVWYAPLELAVIWEDQYELKYMSTDVEQNYGFYVVNQNEWVEIELRAFEDYNYGDFSDRITHLTYCEIIINDDAGPLGLTETNFNGEEYYIYRFAPYLPNILDGGNRPYQKMVEITVIDPGQSRHDGGRNGTGFRAERLEFRDEGLEFREERLEVREEQGQPRQEPLRSRSVSQSEWVLIQGDRPTESTYATTSPEIPFLILHDPPGDASYASFKSSSSHTTAMSMTYSSVKHQGAHANIHLGPNIVWNVGWMFSTQTEIEITNDLSYGFTSTKIQSNAYETSFTFTTTEEYSTSDQDQVIGRGADLYVGGALNLLWGMTKKVVWDDDLAEVFLEDDIMVVPDGFETFYIYTENQIIQNVIPNLIAIGDIASADLWQSFIDMNTANMENAVHNPNHPANISFNAGAGYLFQTTTSSTESNTVYFEQTVSEEFAAEFGMVVNGLGGTEGFTFETAVTIGESITGSYETETTITFELADNDETSYLNDIPDYFTVDIKKDPVYGTPVFNLLGGATSNPWEPNTMPRDGVYLSANTYNISGLEHGDLAAFLLYLGNTSQTGEARRYFLSVDHASNPSGAVIHINGLPVVDSMPFDVPGGQQIQAVMTVAAGPFDFEYEGLTLEFYAEGDRGSTGPEGHYFSIQRSFNVYWEAPYSRVVIGSPEDNWLINQASDNQMEIMFTGYDITKPTFQSLKLEYKPVAGSTWFPAFEIPRDSLLVHPNYIIEPWEVTNLSDGTYRIRAVTTDSVMPNYYTQSLIGIINRSSPVVWGYPQPSNGVLEPGDVISVSFSKDIDPSSVVPGTVEMLITSTSVIVDVNVVCYGNSISIVPNISNYWLENENIRVTVQNLTDLYGNPMSEPVVWEFYVNMNPVYWIQPQIEVIKPLGETMQLTAQLHNSGGQHINYTITDLPVWLTANIYEGTLLPLGTQTIVFTVSDQLGYGTFRETIVADVPGLGREPLLIEISVLANPPAWATTQLGHFEFSMTITGQLSFDNNISTNVNDVIGAFIYDSENGYECRGYAHLQYVDFSGEYLFFLTVHNNSEVGNEELFFRVWNSAENKEHYGIQQVFTFLAGAVHGTPLTPVIVDVNPELYAGIYCNSGWTWISVNLVNPESMELNNLLSNLSPAGDDIIKSQTAYAQYAPGIGWVGDLNQINTTGMFKIRLAGAEQLEIFGNLENPGLTPVQYNSGWNWIGYLPHVSISVNQALAGITNLESGDLIKTQTGYAQYIEDHGWFGSLLFMNPGRGYMLKTSEEGSFNYPDYVIPRDEEILAEISDNFDRLRDHTGWYVDPHEYEYNANVTSIVSFNGSILNSDNILLAAFYEDECRGVAVPVLVQDQWVLFLTQYSNVPDQMLSYKVYIADYDEIFDIDETLPFVNNQAIGHPLEPFVFHVNTGMLQSPQNVTIELTETTLTLSWDEVDGAFSYRVYTSDNPYSGFENITHQGDFVQQTATLPGTNTLSQESKTGQKLRNNTVRIIWQTDIPETIRMFYYITAGSVE